MITSLSVNHHFPGLPGHAFVLGLASDCPCASLLISIAFFILISNRSLNRLPQCLPKTFLGDFFRYFYPVDFGINVAKCQESLDGILPGVDLVLTLKGCVSEN